MIPVVMIPAAPGTYRRGMEVLHVSWCAGRVRRGAACPSCDGPDFFGNNSSHWALSPTSCETCGGWGIVLDPEGRRP